MSSQRRGSNSKEDEFYEIAERIVPREEWVLFVLTMISDGSRVLYGKYPKYCEAIVKEMTK